MKRIIYLLYLLIVLMVGNLGLMGYLLYETKPQHVQTTQASPLDPLSKDEALALAGRLVPLYNLKDLDRLYLQFSDVARMQITKEKLRESVTQLHSVVGRVDDYAYSQTTLAGTQDGKQFKTIVYKIRVSGAAFSTGEMKITVAQDGDGLSVYGFFLNVSS